MKIELELPRRIWEAVKDAEFTPADGLLALAEKGLQMTTQAAVVEPVKEPKKKLKDFTELVDVEPDTVPVIDRADRKNR